MKIFLTGNNLEITEALNNDVRSKLGKLSEFFDKIIYVRVNLKLDSGMHYAHLKMSLPRNKIINAEASSEDMYKTIDMILDKSKTLLIKHKEKLRHEIRRNAQKTKRS